MFRKNFVKNRCMCHCWCYNYLLPTLPQLSVICWNLANWSVFASTDAKDLANVLVGCAGTWTGGTLSWYLIISLSGEWDVEAQTIVKISSYRRKYAGALSNSRLCLVLILSKFKCCSSLLWSFTWIKYSTLLVLYVKATQLSAQLLPIL